MAFKRFDIGFGNIEEACRGLSKFERFEQVWTGLNRFPCVKRFEEV